MGSRWDMEELMKRQSEFCSARWTLTKDRFHRKLYPKADLMRLRMQCFKGAWIAAVLHDGFGFPKSEPRFRAVQTLRGQEVQWTLGAILYKLRYFPLREIQRLREEARVEHRHHADSSLLPSSGLAQLLLLACFILVASASLRLACVLHRHGPAPAPRLPRTQSLWASLLTQPSAPHRSSSAASLLDSVYVDHVTSRKDYVY